MGSLLDQIISAREEFRENVRQRRQLRELSTCTSNGVLDASQPTSGIGSFITENMHDGEDCHSYSRPERRRSNSATSLRVIMEHNSGCESVPVENRLLRAQSEPKCAENVMPQPELSRSSYSSMNCDESEWTNVRGVYYQKLVKIGAGGSSEVWSAKKLNCYKVYAIKDVTLKNTDANVRRAHKNEVDMLIRLQDSPHVMKLYDYEYTEGGDHLLLVLEYGGCDLRTVIHTRVSEKTLDDSFIQYYWKEMLACVCEIHAAGVVHQDIKPANFLVVDGGLRLIDFGIARVMPEGQEFINLPVRLGTISYMSPEAIQGRVCLKSDIWSLGCILYFMVYKKMPFHSFKSTTERTDAILNDSVNIEFHPIGDEYLMTCMKKCLQRKPANRASAEQLWSLQRALMAGRTLPATPSRGTTFAAFAKLLLQKTPRSRQQALEDCSHAAD